jgi:hypothetical protein
VGIYLLILGAYLLGTALLSLLLAMTFRWLPANARFPAFFSTATLLLTPTVQSSMVIDFPMPLGLALVSFIEYGMTSSLFPLFYRAPIWHIGAFIVVAVLNYSIGRRVLSENWP